MWRVLRRITEPSCSRFSTPSYGFLDVADVRWRVGDPEAELLLLRHQLRVVRRQVKRRQLDMADRGDHGRAVPPGKPGSLGWDAGPAGHDAGLGSRASAQKVGGLRSSPKQRPATFRSSASDADSRNGQGQPEIGLCPHRRRVAGARSRRDFEKAQVDVRGPRSEPRSCHESGSV